MKYMKYMSILIVSALIIQVNAKAQPQEIKQRWMRHFPDPHSSHDQAEDLAVMGSQTIYLTGTSTISGVGSYFVTVNYNETGQRRWSKPLGYGGRPAAMTTDASGNLYITGVDQSDYLTIKYNRFGFEQWRASYNGSANLVDSPEDLAVDSNGNVYITGRCGVEPNLAPTGDICTVKYSAAGEEQWTVRYNGPQDVADFGRAVAVDGAGNVVVTGSTFRYFVTMKYTPEGERQWLSKYQHPASNGRVVDMAIDSDNNIIIIGESQGDGTGLDYATVKYNSAGTELWAMRHNGTASSSDNPKALVLDADDNIYVTGYTSEMGSGVDYTTLKYDANGQERWTANYTSFGENIDIPVGMTVDSDANVYVTGESRDPDEIVTVKYTDQGEEKWVNHYDPLNDEFDKPVGIGAGSHDNIYVAGYGRSSDTSDDYVLIKYTPKGEEVWVDRFHGEIGISRVNDMVADTDGNIYVTGETNLYQTTGDYLTLKFDSEGDLQWYAIYDGPANAQDEAVAIDTDRMGNVYVTGKSSGQDTGIDYATLKYDSVGTEQWVARLNGSAFEGDVPTDIAVDQEGDVVVTGYNMMTDRLEDYTTVQYNPNGQIVWLKRYATEGADRAKSLALDESGNAYVTGWSGSDVVTIKYTVSGEEAWTARYTHPSNRSSDARDITVDESGNIYVTGSGAGDYVTLKYSSAGEEQWSATYDDPAEAVDYAQAVAVDQVGNVFVTGVTTGAGTENDITTVKYSADGTHQWATVYDGPANHQDNVVDIAVDTSGDVYIAGSTRNADDLFRDIVILKYSDTGEEVWQTTTEYSFQATGNRTVAFELGGDGNLLLAGYSGRGTRWGIVTVAKLQQESPVSAESGQHRILKTFEMAQNYPNPFNPSTTIRYGLPQASQVQLNVYDLRGQKIVTLIAGQQSAGWHTVQWNGLNDSGQQVSTGVYFYRLVAGEYVETRKMVVMK